MEACNLFHLKDGTENVMLKWTTKQVFIGTIKQVLPFLIRTLCLRQFFALTCLRQRHKQNKKKSHKPKKENNNKAKNGKQIAILQWIFNFFRPSLIPKFLTFYKKKSFFLYWLNYWHTSGNKGTSGFTSNTLLMRIQQMLLV